MLICRKFHKLDIPANYAVQSSSFMEKASNISHAERYKLYLSCFCVLLLENSSIYNVEVFMCRHHHRYQWVANFFYYAHALLLFQT